MLGSGGLSFVARMAMGGRACQWRRQERRRIRENAWAWHAGFSRWRESPLRAVTSTPTGGGRNAFPMTPAGAAEPAQFAIFEKVKFVREIL